MEILFISFVLKVDNKAAKKMSKNKGVNNYAEFPKENSPKTPQSFLRQLNTNENTPRK